MLLDTRSKFVRNLYLLDLFIKRVDTLTLSPRKISMAFFPSLNDHSQVLWAGVLIAVATLGTACGGDTTYVNVLPSPSSDTTTTTATATTTVTATTTAATPTAVVSPGPTNNVATSTDIEACPSSTYFTSSSTWHVSCLAGKRLVGKDSVTGQACELRFKDNGVFEYVTNGVVTHTTPPSSQWLNSSGIYRNKLCTKSDDSFRFFEGRLNGRAFNPTTKYSEYYGISVKIQESAAFPDELSFNEDTAEFSLSYGKKAICKLNNI
jgi:hypothetical protein